MAKNNNAVEINGKLYALAADGCFHPIVEDSKTKSVKGKATKPSTARKPRKGKGDNKPILQHAEKDGFVLNGMTVEATRYLVGVVYTNTTNVAKALDGTVSTNTKKFFKADFTDEVSAKKCFDGVSLTLSDKVFKALKDEQTKKNAEYKAHKVTRPNKEIAVAMRECTNNLKLSCVGENWELAKKAYDKGGIEAVKKIAKQYK